LLSYRSDMPLWTGPRLILFALIGQCGPFLNATSDRVMSAVQKGPAEINLTCPKPRPTPAVSGPLLRHSHHE
ncbi:hypothetical protein GOODEAATRI_029710, partial [Goodea atripinnis]